MSKRFLVVAAVAAVLAIPLSAQDDQQKTIRSTDDRLQISVPADWAEQELNEAAEIQVGSEEQSAYLIVLIELKADLFGWNLDRHSHVTLGTLLSSVDLPKISGPKAMKVAGFPAVQYEIRGASGGSNIVYLHTTIETPELFAQVLAWTLPSQEAATRKHLEKAILSVRPVE